jgi:hypothetical protein
MTDVEVVGQVLEANENGGPWPVESWVQVEKKGQKGWIACSEVNSYTQEVLKARCNGTLEVWSAPSSKINPGPFPGWYVSEQRFLGYLPSDMTDVEVISQALKPQGAWIEVQKEGHKGWVACSEVAHHSVTQQVLKNACKAAVR